MRPLGASVLTLVCAAAVIFLAGSAVIKLGYAPVNADATPPHWERRLAHMALDAAIDRTAAKGANPISMSDDNLQAGIALYVANCAVCHGASDGQPSNIAKGLYQHPPQFAHHGVDDDDESVTYWKIQHGIRMTGMPAYRDTLSDIQIWQISMFLKHLKELSPAARKIWRALPSQAARAGS